MNSDDYLNAKIGRIGADRMSLGLSIIPCKNYGDMEKVRELIEQRLVFQDAIEAAENALRDIACFMSCGGYNDVGFVEFDPAHYAKKIKEAIVEQLITNFKYEKRISQRHF